MGNFLMRDPNFKTEDAVGPAEQIGLLQYQIAYARDRVIQGDWSTSYAKDAIEFATIATELKLRHVHGCSYVDIYANLSYGARAIFRWSYVDRNGAKESGQSHPSIQ